MYVRNVAGFDIKVKYSRTVDITIPFNGKIYSVPDDMTVFKEYLKIIRPFNIKNQEVPYVKKDGEILKEIGHKRRGRPPKETPDGDKPLKGVTLINKDKDGKPKKKRGRPSTKKKSKVDPNAPKRGRGRPRKTEKPGD